MANTNETFIDEVAEAVRRDRINLWFRRWGWVIALLVVAVVGTAAFLEWREAREEAAAQRRGEAILSALEIEERDGRVSALSALPSSGEEGALAAFLLAADQQQSGDVEAALESLAQVNTDLSVMPLYRDLAAVKMLMLQGEEADLAVLEALAAPGAPFRSLALEQLALLDLGAGREEQAVERFQGLLEDAEVGPTQRTRIEALLNAIGKGQDDADGAVAPIGE